MNFDVVVLEFVRANLVTLGLLLLVLKAVAVKTPWAIDDEIIQIFTNFLNRDSFKPKQEQESEQKQEQKD